MKTIDAIELREFLSKLTQLSERDLWLLWYTYGGDDGYQEYCQKWGEVSKTRYYQLRKRALKRAQTLLNGNPRNIDT